MVYPEIEEISEDESLLKKEIHRFAEEMMRPASIEIDRMPSDKYQKEIGKKDSPFMKVYRKFKELGYHRAAVPEVFGGEGLSGRKMHILVEELSWGSSGFGIVFGVDSFPTLFAIMSFDDYLTENYINPWLEDKEAKYRGCWGVTEPGHGSDTLVFSSLFQTPCEAVEPDQVIIEKDGDEWIIKGAKSSFITNAPVSTHVALHTNLNPLKGNPGYGCVVPLDLPGVTKGEPIIKLGQKDAPQGELIFNDVRIPNRNVPIEPDTFHPLTGRIPLTQILCITSAWMAANSTGLARAAFEEALSYSKERVQGGKPICEHQLIKKKLYDMFVKVETARAYSRRVMEHVWERNLMKFEYDASYGHAVAAQVYCKQIAYEVAHDALQIYGGYGTTKDYLVEKLFRDSRVKLIEDGTTDILSLECADDVIRNY